MKFNNYPELINHHKEHVKIDWAINEKTGIPKKSSDKNVLLSYTDTTEDNLEHIVKTNLIDLIHPIIANLIYPVGSVIMTTDSTFDPADQFGGTWQSWTDGYLKVSDLNDAQLKGNDGTKKIATQGGYTITKDMLPKHAHNIEHRHGYQPSGSIVGGNHSHKIMFDSGGSTSYEKTIYSWSKNESDGQYITGGSNPVIENSGDLKLGFRGDSSYTGNPVGKNTTSSITESGDGGFSNDAYKPKYYAVIAWQRTA